MASLLRVPRLHKPVLCNDIRLVKRPIAPCTLLPAGSPGQVTIEGVPYTLTYNLSDDYRILGFRLVNGVNGKVYDVEGVGCVSCTCGDFIYRRAEAKEQEAADLARLSVAKLRRLAARMGHRGTRTAKKAELLACWRPDPLTPLCFSRCRP